MRPSPAAPGVELPDSPPRPQCACATHPTAFPRYPRPSEKHVEADPFRCGRTSLPRQEGRWSGEGGRSTHAPFTGGPWSGVAGFASPPAVRLRDASPSTSVSPPPVPRGGSESGGTMFTSTGSSGLYKAPLSKSLLLVPSALSLLLALLLPHCQKFFVYDLEAVKEDFQSFLLGSWVLSAVGDFILVEAVWYSFGITAARNLPSGLVE
ncbi:hypothetical protein CB1_060782093 [Camelus ferus]|nr:hypothetical protein CB1_060782093 [Camelus ferus]